MNDIKFQGMFKNKQIRISVALSLIHTNTHTTEQESASQLPWWSHCACRSHLTLHTALGIVCLVKALHWYQRTCSLLVELQPSDESRKERLVAHAIFRYLQPLPLLPVPCHGNCRETAGDGGNRRTLILVTKCTPRYSIFWWSEQHLDYFWTMKNAKGGVMIDPASFQGKQK